MINITEKEFFQLLREEAEPVRELMTYFKCAMMEIETKFRVLDEQFSLTHDRNPIESISTRLKSPESIYTKIKRKNLSHDIKTIENEIFDVAGIRVICSFEDDIYMLRDCLLSQDDITLIKEKDYIKNPKPNGYRSLHLIVEVPIFLKNEKRPMKVEIQLRTIAMDSWASLEHRLRYKKNLSEETQKEIADKLMQCADISAELDAIMLSIKKTVSKETGM
ncbi:MAG: GTP pyrophosphokinase family protein [Acutalibacteraceae bacterium]